MDKKKTEKLAALMKSVAQTLKMDADYLDMLLKGKLHGNDEAESFIVELIEHTQKLGSEVKKFHDNLV